MSYRREPEEQAVRVVQPAGDAPLAPRPSRVTLIAAAAVGAAVGFLIGGIATGVGSGERTVTTDTGTLIGLAEPGEDLATPTTAAVTTAAAAPATTAVAEGPPEIAFSDLVPGLDGTLLVALPEGDEMWIWQSGRAAPERAPLPLATGQASWNADASAIAAVAGPLTGRALFLGSGDGAAFVPIVPGARDFAWHASDPTRIAWIADDTDEQVLHVGEIVAPEVVATLTVPIPDSGASARIAAWGDWGFVLTRPAALAGGTVTVTLDASGEVLAEAPAALLAVRDDGLLHVGEAGEVAVADLGLVPLAPGPEGIVALGMWSPAGLLLGSVVATPLGPALQVDGADGRSFRSVLGVDEATIVGWAAGERFAVMWSPDAEELVPGGSGIEIPALIVVDLVDRSTHAIPLPSLPSDFVWVGG